MVKLTAVDSALGPEMKSTGEVMGIDLSLGAALEKSFLAALGGVLLLVNIYLQDRSYRRTRS